MNSELSKLIEEQIREKGGNNAALEEFTAHEMAVIGAAEGDKIKVPEVIPGTISRGFTLSEFAAYVGPGLLIAIAYMDAGSSEAHFVTGNFFGFTLLWVLDLALIPAIIFQSLVVRVATTTGYDLAQLLRNEYPPWANSALCWIAEGAATAHFTPQVLGVAFGLWELLDIP
ncbi:hypothetical protein CYMTET_31308, partial [Cymbomonas tetramitiformis]